MLLRAVTLCVCRNRMGMALRQCVHSIAGGATKTDAADISMILCRLWRRLRRDVQMFRNAVAVVRYFFGTHSQTVNGAFHRWHGGVQDGGLAISSGPAAARNRLIFITDKRVAFSPLSFGWSVGQVEYFRRMTAAANRAAD